MSILIVKEGHKLYFTATTYIKADRAMCKSSRKYIICNIYRQAMFYYK